MLAPKHIQINLASVECKFLDQCGHRIATPAYSRGRPFRSRSPAATCARDPFGRRGERCRPRGPSGYHCCTSRARTARTRCPFGDRAGPRQGVSSMLKSAGFHPRRVHLQHGTAVSSKDGLPESYEASRNSPCQSGLGYTTSPRR
jgi:hypothetical protein